MFNWFKNKLDNLIPSDINKGFMSSNFVTTKVGEKITIPEDMVCFVSFHDKIYAELEAGTHTLNKELLSNLYSKQQKGNRPLKKFKLDLFVVNLKTQNIRISYTDKIPVSKHNVKFIVDINASIKVENAKTFNNFICAEFYNPFAASTNEFIGDCIESFVRKCFLKIRLSSYEISSDLHENIKQKLAKYLNKLSLSLCSFSLCLTTKDKKIGNQSQSIFKNSPANYEIDKSNDMENELQNKNLEKTENSLNSVDQTENINYTQIEPTQTNLTVCPVCNTKIIKGSIYCHRCGNSLK